MIAVTGSTGQLGGRVARIVSGRGETQLLVGRDPDRQPVLSGAHHRGPAAYDEPEAMRAALRGATTLFLVSANLSGRRLEEHRLAIDAALAVGVTRIVYLSLLGAAEHATYVNARDHWQTEEHLAGLGVSFTILRAGFYTTTLFRLVDEEGVVRGPADGGRVSLVSHDDLAEVAAEVLLDGAGTHDGQTLSVTGPGAVTLDEATAQFAEATGRPFTFVDQTHEEAVSERQARGVDPTRVRDWVSWHEAIANGEVAEVSDVVPRLTGHRARDVAETAARQGSRP